MLMRAFNAGCLAAGLACVSTVAGAAVVDFEDIVFPPGNPIATSTTSGGFLFTSNHLHLFSVPNSPGFAGNGTQFLGHEGGFLGAPITMAPVAGGTFSLSGFDGAETFVGNIEPTFPNATAINVTGNLSGGGTVSVSFQLDGILDGAGGVADFQNFVLPGTFTNLTSVIFSGSITGGSTNAGLMFDNLKIELGGADVPSPAPLALLGLAAAGLGIPRRRRR